MPWRRATLNLCRRHGFPPAWIDLFEAEEELPDDPREASALFEQWALTRLASIWAGKTDDAGLDGTLAAFLVQRYLADSARVLAYRYRLSDDEWEDLVASAGERAMRVFSEKHIEAPRPYLFRTIKRAIWEYLRKARREVAVLELPPVVDSQAGPETRSMWSELLERFMKECYQQLSGEEQRLFEALVIEGRSAAEVGEMFGLVPNAVGVRKFRVRKWLRECLKEHADLEDPFDETV